MNRNRVLDVLTGVVALAAIVIVARSFVNKPANVATPSFTSYESTMRKATLAPGVIAMDSSTEKTKVSFTLVMLYRHDCPVCKSEKPVWTTLASGHRAVAVAEEENQANREFAHSSKIDPRFRSFSSLFATDVPIPGVPTTLVVDGAGRVVFARVGKLVGDDSLHIAKILE